MTKDELIKKLQDMPVDGDTPVVLNGPYPNTPSLKIRFQPTEVIGYNMMGDTIDKYSIVSENMLKVLEVDPVECITVILIS